MESSSWGLGIAAVALGVLAGTALQMQQAALSSAWAYAAAGVAGLALLGVAVWGARARCQGVALAGLKPLAFGVAAACLAFGQAGWRASDRVAQVLPAALEGVDLALEGRVSGLPQVDADGLRFPFEIERAQGLGGSGQALPEALSVRGSVWLNWPSASASGSVPAADALSAGPPPLRAGERWRLPVRLRQPHGLFNPGGFDAELWCFEQQIGAVGSVRAAGGSEPVRLEGPRWWRPLDFLADARQRWRDQILRSNPQPEAAGLFAALAVGDQSAINSEGWALYRDTGIAHLVSISGMHITLFAALASWLVNRLWRRSPSLMLAVPAPSAGRWGGLALATLYALLAGWGVPAQRTVGMLALAVALRSAGRAWPMPLICLCAAAVVVLADPWALLQPGFWLSFGAVTLLLVAEPGEKADEEADNPVASADDPPLVPAGRVTGWTKWGLSGRSRLWQLLRSDLRTQFLVSLGLGPLSLVLFGQLSLVGVVANLFAVPWVTFVITPLALLGVAWSPLWALGVWALAPLHAALAWLAAWPGGVLGVPQPSVAAAALALAGGIISVLRVPLSWRLMACLWWLPLLWPNLPRPVWGQFELVAADVGQGSAILVRTASHLLVHDAGPQFSRDSDAGQRILLPLLRTLGESHIDELVLSHRDADHVGGAPALLKKVQVSRLRASLEPGHPLLGLGLPTLNCAAGQRWEWEGVRFEVLHPEPGAAAAGVKPNSVSCVLRVRGANGQSALLTGDLEADQERKLVAELGPSLKRTVLLVPHHGSRTSSTPEFLAAVQPSVAVIQVGYRSRFGHPHPDVLARYASADIPVVRSDSCGAWRWAEGKSNCAREDLRRYWHWRQSKFAPSAGADVARVPAAGERE